MSETDKIAERLRSERRARSKISKWLASGKTARNRDDGEPGAFYEAMEPEETTEWKGADAIEAKDAEITSLRAQLDEARTKIARLVAILDHENPWDQKHVNELNESMIDIRALLSESKT